MLRRSSKLWEPDTESCTVPGKELAAATLLTLCSGVCAASVLAAKHMLSTTVAFLCKMKNSLPISFA